MKKLLLIPLLAISLASVLFAQGKNDVENKAGQDANLKIKITVGNTTLNAIFLDNLTSRALMEKLPLTVPMQDLYNREMCYHFPDPLPTDNVEISGYNIGEIIYWPPRHSLVIMYAQNGERFGMQKVGRIDDRVSIFETTGDVSVTFESIK
jgi:hypothetical protein